MPSRAVSIADLKTNLSAHLERVRSGEELLIRDRRTTSAKIVPLAVTEDVSADEVALAAEGKVRLPTKRRPASEPAAPLRHERSCPQCRAPASVRALAASVLERHDLRAADALARRGPRGATGTQAPDLSA